MTMEAKPRKSQNGFIKAIVLIIIAISILIYFGLDVKGWISSPNVQAVISKIGTWVSWLWLNIIKEPALWIWNEIIIGILWEKVGVIVLEKIKG